MNYQQYGISADLVERVKLKMKNEHIKEKVKAIVQDVTKTDLQNRSTIKRLLNQVSKAVGENIPETQAEKIISFVIEQKINPQNTFHLIKLWGMFR